LLQGVLIDLGDCPRRYATGKRFAAVSTRRARTIVWRKAYRVSERKGKGELELQLYQQLVEKATEEAERDRGEIQPFVVALRDAKAASAQPRKP